MPKAKALKTTPSGKRDSGLSLVVAIIVATLISFLWLFLKNEDFEISLGSYNIKVFFDISSPTFYIVIGLIILGAIFLVYNLPGKSRRRKKEKPKELKAGIETGKREKLIRKIVEKKAAHKKIWKKTENTGIFYFVLFLLSIILFFAALFYGNMPTMVLALILMFLSLLAYGKLKKPGTRKITFQELFKMKPKKEASAKETNLSKIRKIELGRYETYFDALYKIVEKKGRVKLSVVAKYFGVDRKKVEEWASILEEHNLLKMHYPAVGEPELIKINASGGKNLGNR